MRTSGFTLVELLVAMAMAGIVLLAVGSFFESSSRVSSQEFQSATQTTNIQRAVGLIGDDIRRAEQIVASGGGTSLTISSPTGLTPPATAGANRLDLYITKPAGSSCAATDVYEYRSYFTLPRSALVGSTNTWVALPADTLNNTRSVLVQYIGCVTGLSVVPTTGTIRLFNDYVGLYQLTYLGAGTVTVQLQSVRTVGGRTLSTPRVPTKGTYYSRRF